MCSYRSYYRGAASTVTGALVRLGRTAAKYRRFDAHPMRAQGICWFHQLLKVQGLPKEMPSCAHVARVADVAGMSQVLPYLTGLITHFHWEYRYPL